MKVDPGAEAWLPPLERAGVDTSGEVPPDVLVTVAPPTGAEDIPSVIVEGASGPRGYTNRRYVIFGRRDRPVLLVPRDRPNVTSYALSAWSGPRTRTRALRGHLIRCLPRTAVRLARWPEVTIASRDPGPPFVVAAALEKLGLESPVDWLLVCGQSDDLGRAAFLLFPESAARPRWIVKFVRIPFYSDPIERDERGLAAVSAAGGAAAAHAPHFLARFDVNGLAASVESAAVGRRLSAILGSAGSRADKWRTVEAVAEWIIRVGVETRHGDSAREVSRLRTDVLASWPGSQDELLAGVAPLPAILQHNDLGSWNIISEGQSDFVVVDWESANSSGLPLWDLWYFLADALRLLDNEDPSGGDAFIRLFRGDARSSADLFRWTRKAVDALDIPVEAVARLATLCWLHHGLSHGARTAMIDRFARGGRTPAPVAAEYSRLWLSDPGLGIAWRTWRED